tara:strand:+ start:3693 stop:4040 length:348 start_codon:yes stop_codon:yes gene_type:complete
MTNWQDILKDVDPYERHVDYTTSGGSEGQQVGESNIDLDIGSTNYAKDLGDAISFGGYVDESMNAVIPKNQLASVVEAFDKSGEYFKPITKLTQITMSNGPTNEFVSWYKKTYNQ